METFIGKPHVYTIDVNNLELVESTVKEILSSEVTNNLIAAFFSLVLKKLIKKKSLECLVAKLNFNISKTVCYKQV